MEILGTHGVSKVILLAPLFFFIAFLSPIQAKTELTKNKTFLEKVVGNTFFMPRDSDVVYEILETLIADAQSIKAAHYSMSNKRIIAALAQAASLGKDITLVLDPGAFGSGKNVLYLLSCGVRIYLCTHKRAPLMHHKIFVFNNVLDNNTICSWGSLNMSQAAFSKNAEDITFSDSYGFITSFNNEIERLIELSEEVTSKFVLSLYKTITSDQELLEKIFEGMPQDKNSEEK